MASSCMMSSVYDIGEGELEADPHYPAYPLGNYSSMISRVSLSLYLSLDFSLFISLSLSIGRIGKGLKGHGSRERLFLSMGG